MPRSRCAWLRANIQARGVLLWALVSYTVCCFGSRFRGSDSAPQRASPRTPLHLKTTASSEANGAHHRPVVDRTSPKLGDRHSPRSPLPEASFVLVFIPLFILYL
jgi:hypothetical protein